MTEPETELLDYEISILRVIGGSPVPRDAFGRPVLGGAAYNACLEFLQGSGYVTRGETAVLTEKGKAALKEADSEADV